MKWVTRENAVVDRVACPWLIKRFVDPDAEFLCVPSDRVQEVAATTGAIPFDVEGAELGHVDGRRSFESILVKYRVDDPALAAMAKIVLGRISRPMSSSPLRQLASGPSPRASACCTALTVSASASSKRRCMTPFTRIASPRSEVQRTQGSQASPDSRAGL